MRVRVRVRVRARNLLVFSVASIGGKNSVNPINHRVQNVSKFVVCNGIPLILDCGDHVLLVLRPSVKLANMGFHQSPNRFD